MYAGVLKVAQQRLANCPPTADAVAEALVQFNLIYTNAVKRIRQIERAVETCEKNLVRFDERLRDAQAAAAATAATTSAVAIRPVDSAVAAPRRAPTHVYANAAFMNDGDGDGGAL